MKALLLAGAAALALTGGATAGVNHMSAGGAHGAAQRVIHAPPPGLTTLYDQNIGDAGYGWFSQSLSSYPQYSEYLADDFIVPAGHTWKVKEVDTTAFYYLGSGGPAHSVNVLFWKDNKGLPSQKNGPAVECDNLTPKSGLDTGAFQIKLPRDCSVKLKGGSRGKRYWLTVQANMDGINSSGYWAWTQNLTINNDEAVGYYYGGGNSVADPKCLQQFETLSDCWATGQVDLAFALLGKDSG